MSNERREQDEDEYGAPPYNAGAGVGGAVTFSIENL